MTVENLCYSQAARIIIILHISADTRVYMAGRQNIFRKPSGRCWNFGIFTSEHAIDGRCEYNIIIQRVYARYSRSSARVRKEKQLSIFGGKNRKETKAIDETASVIFVRYFMRKDTKNPARLLKCVYVFVQIWPLLLYFAPCSLIRTRPQTTLLHWSSVLRWKT